MARITPPVVNVSTRRHGGGHGDGEEGDLLERLFGGGRERGAPKRSLGSGVIVDAAGYVLTNNHVVGDAAEIRVTLADEREFTARVVGRDARTDVALLKIDATGLPVATLGDSDALRVGDQVVAVGNPFGLNQTVTAGIVSAKGRVIGAGPYDDFIQTDASINPGNSGGPLFDLTGRVVGINTAIVESARGIGFAIPVNLIKAELAQLRGRGHVVRGFLGLSVQHVTPLLARAFALPRTAGALVSALDVGGAAARGGVHVGDVILSVDGHPVETSDRLAEMVASHVPGSAVRLGLVRAGRFVQIGATVDALPEEAGEDEGRGSRRHRTAGRDAMGRAARRPGEGPLGIKVRSQTPAEAAVAGVPGVVVDEVSTIGPSAGLLEEGDIIVEIDRVPARSVEEFVAVTRRVAARGVESSRPLLLRIRRGGGSLFVALDHST